MRNLGVCCDDDKKWQDNSDKWVTWWLQFVLRGLPALCKLSIILSFSVTDKHWQRDW